MTLIQLLQWSFRLIEKRRSIQLGHFSEYMNKKTKINPEMNKGVFILAQFVVLAGLGLTIYFQFLDFQVYKYYFFLLIPLALTDGSIIFYELTKNRYHYDLEPIDEAFYRIEGIKKNADKYIDERHQLILKLDAFIIATKELLGDLLKGDSSTIFEPILDELSKNYESVNKKIQNLNDNIQHLEEGFIAELKKYINSNDADFKQLFKNHSVDDVDHDAEGEFKAIQSKTQSRVQGAIHSFCSINARMSLGESQQLFSILNQFESTIETKLVQTMLEKLSVESTEYSEFNRIFYHSNVDFPVIFESYIIPNDKSWFFDQHLMQIPNPGVIRKILKEVLTQKAEKSLSRLIQTLDAKLISDIEDLTQLIDVDPEILRQINVYARISRRLYQSINPMNQTENMQIILKKLKNPLPETQEVLNAMNQARESNSESIQQSINRVYKSEISRLAPLIIDSFELVDFIQSLLAQDADTTFDHTAIESYIMEAAFQLNPTEILLGFAFTMLNVKHLKTPLEELGEEPWKTKIERLFYHLKFEPSAFKTQPPQVLFKNLISHNPRFKSYQSIMPQIIMRLEKRRLSLDLLS